MHGFSKRDIFILPLFFLIALCAMSSQQNTVLADARWQGYPSAPYIPLMIGGFSTQPTTPNNSVLKGQTISISAISKKPDWELSGFFLKIYQGHQWFESDDNKTWHPCKKGNKSDLTVELNNPGIKRFQLYDTYFDYPFGIKNVLHSYYSDVLTINVKSHSLKAQSAVIRFDQDYLLNSSNPYFTGTTYAHADLTPPDSTATSKWGSSNPSVASINEKTGQITANNQGRSGKVRIEDIINNGDTNPLDKSKIITVGGGLTDQDAILNDRVTFRLMSTGDSTRDEASNKVKVKWFRIQADGTHTLLTTQADPYAYTIDKVGYGNVGDRYYAQITINKKTISTNIAKLNETVPVNPRVTLETIMSSLTKSDPKDNGLTLNSVTKDDNIIYSMGLSNKGYQDFEDSYLDFDIPTGMKVQYVIMGNSASDESLLNEDKYDIHLNQNNDGQTLKINIGKFNRNEDRIIEVHTVLQDNGNGPSFVTDPYFYGLERENKENPYKAASDGNILTLNFKNPMVDKLKPNVQPEGSIKPDVKNIEFDPLVTSQQNIIDHRTEATNDPNFVATFEDDRSKKSQAFLFLKEETPLQGNGKLDGQLMYYQPGQNPQSIANKVLVEQSAPNQTLAPIKWSRNKGLLLNLKRCDSATGEYKTTLDWTIQNSI